MSINLNLNCERAEPATKSSWKEKTKVKSDIPILNAFYVEPNFLEGVLSSVSYDDDIGVPLIGSILPRVQSNVAEDHQMPHAWNNQTIFGVDERQKRIVV